jgi:hypothetical protein
MAERGDITQLLHNPAGLSGLKRIASAYLRRERTGHILQATGLALHFN